jgi:hypothetical protein
VTRTLATQDRGPVVLRATINFWVRCSYAPLLIRLKTSHMGSRVTFACLAFLSPLSPVAMLSAQLRSVALHRSTKTSSAMQFRLMHMRGKPRLSVLLYAKRFDALTQRVQVALQSLPAVNVVTEVATRHEADGFTAATQRHVHDVSVCLDDTVPVHRTVCPGDRVGTENTAEHSTSCVQLHVQSTGSVVRVVEPSAVADTTRQSLTADTVATSRPPKSIHGRMWAKASIQHSLATHASGAVGPVPEVLDAVVDAVVSSVKRAQSGAAPAITSIDLSTLPGNTGGGGGRHLCLWLHLLVAIWPVGARHDQMCLFAWLPASRPLAPAPQRLLIEGQEYEAFGIKGEGPQTADDKQVHGWGCDFHDQLLWDELVNGLRSTSRPLTAVPLGRRHGALLLQTSEVGGDGRLAFALGSVGAVSGQFWYVCLMTDCV